VTLIQAARRVTYRGSALGNTSQTKSGLVLRELLEAPFVRALATQFELVSEAELTLPEPVARHLELTPGDDVVCLPLP
jgi:hypothetical protein